MKKVKAIAQLLVHYNWTWVGLIRGDHEYGRFAVQGLLRELEGSDVFVAYQEMIPLLYNTQRALEIMQVGTVTLIMQLLTCHFITFPNLNKYLRVVMVLVFLQKI